MKAAYIEQHGGPEVLKYGDLPDPQPKPGEVVVDIHAASINGADWKVRAGGANPKTDFPYILGRDFSGIVSALGDGVDDFEIGDAVFAVCDAGQEGAYAEKIAINAAIVAKKPDGIAHADAAALALAGLTALISIEDTLHLASGETILIQGGAGGVAGVAIELAKHFGAHVITTASARNHDYVRSLGADEVIDYAVRDFTEIGQICDVAYDTVGGDVGTRSIDVLKPGGRIASIAAGAAGVETTRADVTSLRPNVARDRPHLDRIAELFEAGAIHAPEITRYPLSEAVAAHVVSEARHLRGKLVFDIR